MQRRYVETLDTQRRRRQRQSAFELQECPIGAVVGIPRAHHITHKGMAGIFGRHIEQTVLLTALGPMKVTGALTFACEPLPQRLRVLKFDREVDLGWNIGRLVVIAFKKARLELLLVNIQTLIENELAGSNRSPLAHDKNAGGRDGLFAIKADHVDVDTRWEDNLLTIVQAPNDIQAALDAGGTLKVECLGGLRHFGRQLVDDVFAVTGQKTFHAFDVLGIVGRSNRADARTRAAPDMVVKAGAPVLRANHIDDVLFALVGLDDTPTPTPLRTGCRANGDDLTQRIDGLTCRAAVGIGAKIARAGLMALARVFNSGK